MDKFLAYFDILGFKEFIENNTSEHIEKYMEHLLREAQSAAADRNYKDGKPGSIEPDLSYAKVHCLHVSDSIIFWTEDTSLHSFHQITNCSLSFLRNIVTAEYFAVRGCIVSGDFNFRPLKIKNAEGISFYNSSLYGKALVNAYVKADEQNWTGCYIDSSAIKMVEESVVDNLIYGNKVVYYPIPLKDSTFTYQHVLTLRDPPINKVSFKNLAQRIERLFVVHMNKKPISESARTKMMNTIKFLGYLNSCESCQNKHFHSNNTNPAQ